MWRRRDRAQPQTGPRSNWKYSGATDRFGILIGWVIAGANRHDSILLQPTLRTVTGRGLLLDVPTLHHLDRGYDSNLTTQRCQALGLDGVCVPHLVPAAPRGHVFAESVTPLVATSRTSSARSTATSTPWRWAGSPGSSSPRRVASYPREHPDAIRANLSLIDRLDVEELQQPSSLKDEMTIIAKALARAS